MNAIPSDASSRPFAPRILIVDDDPHVTDALVTFLQPYGWDVLTAATGEEALARMGQERDLDLILLDVKLPGISGFDVLEQSQKAGVVAPIVMISTSTEDEHRLRAFGLGAEDYLSKPLDPDTLKARVEEIVSASGPFSLEDRYQIGSVTVDLKQEKLYRGEDVLPIRKVEFDLLRVLLQHRGRAVARKRLLEEGLGIDQDTITFTITLRAIYDMLDRHIELLRQLIEPDPRRPTYLERVYGQGYRLRL